MTDRGLLSYFLTPRLWAELIDALSEPPRKRNASQTADDAVAATDCGTIASVTFIWACVGLNFLVLAVLRPQQESWHPASYTVGYAGLALQALAFYRCRHTDPGTVSAEWEADARAGLVEASICMRSGQLVPPRGLYVRRYGGRVVLGFDHYCFWLGAPVGLYNRRHFILFILYTTVMAAIAAVHLGHELLLALPARLGHDRAAMARLAAQPDAALSGWRKHGLETFAAPSLMDAWAATDGRVARVAWPLQVGLVWTLELLAAAYAHGRLRYLVLVAAALVTDVASAVLVGNQVVFHMLLVRRGRTTLNPDDDSYDAGRRLNWEHVFGPSRLLWMLPLRSVGPTCDGYSWPEGGEKAAPPPVRVVTSAGGGTHGARERFGRRSKA